VIGNGQNTVADRDCRPLLATSGEQAAKLRAEIVVLLTVLRRRSGTLAAAPCQCAALLAGAPWRVVALAGRFGQALGCVGQLEDDLADREEDAAQGRQTLPLALAHLASGSVELGETASWVLIQRFQREALEALERLPLPPARKEILWTLFPEGVHSPAPC